jgi:hypothetical protein
MEDDNRNRSGGYGQTGNVISMKKKIMMTRIMK